MKSLLPPELVVKLINLALAAVIALAFIGYFVGVWETHDPPVAVFESEPRSPIDDEDVTPPYTYSELRSVRRGPNAEWTSHLDTLQFDVPDEIPSEPPSDAEFQRALEQRAELRAYVGAPPVVPHPVDQLSSHSCMLCHGRDMRIEDRIVPKMSHPHYANCLQCHAESQNPALGEPLGVENAFVGLTSPGRGEREDEGMPPLVPHTMHMREDCLSCHGVTGMPGLRSTHPIGNDCLFCHQPHESFDIQRLFEAQSISR